MVSEDRDVSIRTPIVAFEVPIPSTGPWWAPDPEDPPAGAVIVADLIAAYLGTERQGWAFVYECASDAPCLSTFGVLPVSAKEAPPSMCANCGGPVRLRDDAYPIVPDPQQLNSNRSGQP